MRAMHGPLRARDRRRVNSHNEEVKLTVSPGVDQSVFVKRQGAQALLSFRAHDRDRYVNHPVARDSLINSWAGSHARHDR